MATKVQGTSSLITHPLEPLTPEEITTAVALLKAERPLSGLVRFVSLTLHEPTKGEALRSLASSASWAVRATKVLA